MAEIYKQNKDYKNELKLRTESLEILREKNHDIHKICNEIINIAIAYEKLEDYESQMKYALKLLDLRTKQFDNEDTFELCQAYEIIGIS